MAGLECNLRMMQGKNPQGYSFFAPLLSTDDILTPIKASFGTSGTFARASSQYVTDFEGLTKEILSGCPAVEGSRVVTNLLTYSDDFSNAAWVKTGTASVSGNTINLPDAADTVYQAITFPFKVGSLMRASVWLSGSGTVSLIVSSVGRLGIREVTLTSTPQRFASSLSCTTAAEENTTLYFIISRNTTGTATSVVCSQPQLEYTTGQTIYPPSEYVPTTSAAITKCYSTTNGNSVSDVSPVGLVTEALGVPLPQSYPDRLNSTAYSVGAKIQVAGWWYNCTTAGTSAETAPTFATGKSGRITVADNDVVWTLGGRLLLGYVSEPASTNKCTAYGIIPADTLGEELATGNLTIGQKYQITARDTADFTADGSVNNTVGTQFVATAATVTLDATNKVKRVQWGVGEKSFHNGTSFVQNIDGVTISGSATTASMSIVTDQTELEKAGLAWINQTYKVYKFDNSAGSEYSYAGINGETGNTNIHSFSLICRAIGGSGTSYIKTGATIGITYIPDAVEYRKVTVTNITPDAVTNKIVMRVTPGDTIYFLLPQLEELSYATSVMPTAGATATRAATSLSYPAGGNLTANNSTLYLESHFTSSAGNAYAFTSGADGSNRMSFIKIVLELWTHKKTLNSSYDTDLGAYVLNTSIKYILKLFSATDYSSFVSGVKTAGNNGAANTIGTLLRVGSTATGVVVGTQYTRNLKIYSKPLSDAHCIQLTQ